MEKLTWMKRCLCLILIGVLLLCQQDLTVFASEVKGEPADVVSADEGTNKGAGEIVKPQAPDTAKAEAVTWQSVTLSWSRVTGAEGYAIYRKSAQESEYQLLARVEGVQTTSYVDQADLVTGTGYTYRIYAYVTYSEDGVVRYAESEDMAVVTATPSLGKTSVSAVSGDGSSVILSWSAVDGAEGYVVLRAQGSSSVFEELAAVENVLTFTDSSTANGQNFRYKVKAYRTVGKEKVYGEESEEAQVQNVPTAPQITFENLTYNSITLRWSSVVNAEGYVISRALESDGAFTTIKTVNRADVLTYRDTGLSLGTTYYYKVRAFQTVDGEKVYGIESKAFAQQCIPAAPKLSSEAAGTTAVKLTWKKVDMPSQNSGYYIYQVTDGIEKRVKTCKNTSVNCTIKGLTYGVKYAFKIRAYVKDTNGKTILGAESNLLTTKTKLKTVTIKSVNTSKSSGLAIRWNYTSSAEEDTYLIYRSVKKETGYKKIATVAKKAGAKKGVYMDSKVALGQKYYYKIICKKNMTGGKTIKSDYSKPVGAKAVPAAPKLVVKSYGVTSVRLTWNKIKGSTSSGYVNGYQIYRSTSKNGKFKRVATIGSGTTISYVDTGLTTGSVYYYKIRAYGKVNNKAVCGAFSDVQSVKVVPGQVSVNATAVDYTTVRISWSTISGCTGYKVYRSTEENGKFKLIATCGGERKNYEDKKVKTGTRYYYKVRAFVTKNGSDIYGTYSKVVNAVPILNKPTGLQAVLIDSSQVKLMWNAVPGAQTYTILRATSPEGKYKIASEICTTNSFIDANASPGHTYYYKVYAVRGEYKSEMTDYVTAVSATLELNTDRITVKVGGSAKVTATAKPTANIIWTSSDPSIAYVTTDGTIYGVKLGTTVVKASANGITKSVAVTVSDTVPPKGLEISKDSGTVDFNAVKAAGYEFVMLRASSGLYGDTTFSANYTKAKAAGLKVGAYCYAQARTVDEAKQEASKALEIIQGCTLDYPVVYDMEEQTLLYGLTAADRNNMIDAFRNTIAASGKSYKFALHTTYEWLTKYLDNTRLANMDLWVTNYREETTGHGYTGNGKVVMWCYTQKALVSGVSGKVKVSISYY